VQSPVNPPHTPVVYLRGAGMPEKLWDMIEPELWQRGNRTLSMGRGQSCLDAWCLARAGVPVVYADFSDSLDDEPPAAGGGHFHGYNRYLVIGMVRARHHPATRDEQLLLVNGGRSYGPWTQDPRGFSAEAFGELVATAFRQGRLKNLTQRIVYPAAAAGVF
jgi:hypothetical protein